MKTTSLLLTLLGLQVAQPAVAQQTLVAIFVHADDERIVAPIMARYAREGHKVRSCSATKMRGSHHSRRSHACATMSRGYCVS